MRNESMRSALRQSGFTLVELMIVMVIVAILAAIALPIYRSQIQQSQRTDAKDALLNLASREERYYTLNNQYTATLTNLGYTAGLLTAQGLPLGSGSIPDYYMTATASSSNGVWSFTLTAAPNSASTQATDSCGTYTLDNFGNQGNTGNTTASSSCW